MIGFRLHTEHIDEFANYYSQLTPTTNVRDAFFRDIIYYVIYCDIEGSGIDCPDDLTDVPNYSQADMITFVINAVYVFAHALQNFLYKNCDIPLRWDRAKRQCVGMKHNLTSANLLGYLFNVSFNGTQNHTVSFDENGDPLGVYEIVTLQVNNREQYEYISIGFWNSVTKDNSLVLNNNTEQFKKLTSRCSEPCG